MKNKSNLFYKIITVITIGLPLPLYLFLSATLFNIVPDYEIKNAAIDSVYTVEYDEYVFIYSDSAEAVYDGVVVQDSGYYGFYVDDDDILQIGSKYYNNQLEDIKTMEIQKQTSYKLPLTFFISLFGVGLVTIIISGKMDIYKKYPRISALVTLITVTSVLFIINTIISNILNVFLIASASWAIYCLEYLINNNIISNNKAVKEENDLISTLKEALK